MDPWFHENCRSVPAFVVARQSHGLWGYCSHEDAVRFILQLPKPSSLLLGFLPPAAASSSANNFRFFSSFLPWRNTKATENKDGQGMLNWKKYKCLSRKKSLQACSRASKPQSPRTRNRSLAGVGGKVGRGTRQKERERRDALEEKN